MITEGGSQLDPDLHLPTGKIQTEREQREGQELHHQQAENRAVGGCPALLGRPVVWSSADHWLLCLSEVPSL